MLFHVSLRGHDGVLGVGGEIVLEEIPSKGDELRLPSFHGLRVIVDDVGAPVGHQPGWLTVNHAEPPNS